MNPILALLLLKKCAYKMVINMACYHPLVLVPLGGFLDDDEKQARKEAWQKIKKKAGADYHVKSKNRSGYQILPQSQIPYIEKLGMEYVEIPCGHCIGCKLDKSIEWANRVTMEVATSHDCYFLTLTYDDDHLPISKESLIPTLKKDDFTKFIHDVRQYFKRKGYDEPIRFFGCGEYGSTTCRPHLHILLFNCPIPDLSYDFKSISQVDGSVQISQHRSDKTGMYYMFSEVMQEIWGKGNVLIDECNWSTAAYVARYTTKKLDPSNKKDDNLYNQFGIEKEFLRMSTHPGIGYQFFVENIDDIIKYDSITITNNKGASTIKLPRYFDKLLDKDNGFDLLLNKNARKMRAERKQGSLIRSTTMPLKDIREAEECKKLGTIKALSRD